MTSDQMACNSDIYCALIGDLQLIRSQVVMLLVKMQPIVCVSVLLLETALYYKFPNT